MNSVSPQTTIEHDARQLSDGIPPLPLQHTDSSIKIKTIAHIAFVTLSSICAAALAVSITMAVIGVAVGMMTTAATVSAVALAMLLAAKAWQQWTPYLPSTLRIVANYIQSVVTAVFSILALGIIFPINLEKQDPKNLQECNPHQIPVLLIHGFCGSSNNWLYHRQRLLGAGYQNIFTINLGTIFQSVEQYTSLVRQKVADIRRITGMREIILVGHSMGGLVCRDYRYKHAEADQMHVRKIITVGAPLNGTYTAYLASWISAAAKEMEPSSPYVRQQQERAAADDRTDYVYIGTHVDSIVIPTSSALEGGARQARRAMLNATGHIEFLFSDATADLIIDELRDCIPILAQEEV